MHALHANTRELRQGAVVFGGVGRDQPQRQAGGAKVAGVDNSDLPTLLSQRACGARARNPSPDDTGDLR